TQDQAGGRDDAVIGSQNRGAQPANAFDQMTFAMMAPDMHDPYPGPCAGQLQKMGRFFARGPSATGAPAGRARGLELKFTHGSQSRSSFACESGVRLRRSGAGAVAF